MVCRRRCGAAAGPGTTSESARRWGSDMIGRTAGALLLLLTAGPGLGAESGGVRGRVTLGVEDADLSSVQPLVVFLDAPSGRLDYPVPKEVPKISQKNATFSPSFLLITAGQS